MGQKEPQYQGIQKNEDLIIKIGLCYRNPDELSIN